MAAASCPPALDPANPPAVLLFDYGNVLYTWDARAAIAGRVPLAVWEEYVGSGVFGSFNALADAGMPLEEIVCRQEAEYSGRVQWHAALREYFEHFSDSLTGPVPGMAALVRDVAASRGTQGSGNRPGSPEGITRSGTEGDRARGSAEHTRPRLALLSNFHHELFEANRHLCPELACFEHLFISGQMGMTKPSPQIYEAALQTLGVPAPSVLFIDDSPVNIEAAAALGVATHLFEGVGGLRARLIEGGILPAPATA